MEVLKDFSQLSKGCEITFVKNGNIKHYEFLMVHPNHGKYILAIESWTQEVARIYIPNLLNGDYYIGKYSEIFVYEERIKFHQRMIKCLEQRIKELKERGYE